MKREDKIFVAGHNGLVGSAISKNLRAKGYSRLILRSHAELDLMDTAAVMAFFAAEQPDYVFLAAAKVGGIIANNTYRADFIYQNLMIQNNVIHAAYRYQVKKLLFLGSTCIYPKDIAEPITEDRLLTGPLEYTNEPYAIAKIAGIKTCESYNLQYGTNFISVMPTNLYGRNDNFNLETSHVLPALLRKIFLAKQLHENNWQAIRADLDKRPVETISGKSTQEEIKAMLLRYGIGDNTVEIWGTGTPMREFLWSEDMADACVFVMEQVDFADLISSEKEKRNTHINIGTGKEISIQALASLIASIVGFSGTFRFNTEKPDGTMRKLTDVTKLNQLGWRHSMELPEGVKALYAWYLSN
ncbi:MAG: GDP-L-fucose synthase [Dysgonamonadaceae bacterium]|jgi:GDP-L-fucose synthase|nr:GDP-L-fucose synthase [Dysgonamonadaceae bacterium]